MPSIRKGNARHRRAIRRAAAAPAAIGYAVYDSRITAAENPHSFYQPCEARRNAVAAGDAVKLVFEPLPEGMSERMWVEVTGADGDALTGILANQPFGELAGVLSIGDRVRFDRGGIITIDTDRADDPAETCLQDDVVFSRCLMDARVYNDEATAVRLVRDEPQPADYANESFPWGGWRIEAEGFEPGMPTEVGTPVIAMRRLGAGSFTPAMLHAPEGSAFALADGEWRQAA